MEVRCICRPQARASVAAQEPEVYWKGDDEWYPGVAAQYSEDKV